MQGWDVECRGRRFDYSTNSVSCFKTQLSELCIGKQTSCQQRDMLETMSSLDMDLQDVLDLMAEEDRYR